MARYTGPVCRLCRRERMKLYLKGTKCDSMKCPIERRPYPPGDHGRSRRQQGSEYLTQLREKQKARRIYGLMEKQFSRVYEEANRRQGVTGENLLQLLGRHDVSVDEKLTQPKAGRLHVPPLDYRKLLIWLVPSTGPLSRFSRATLGPTRR